MLVINAVLLVRTNGGSANYVGIILLLTSKAGLRVADSRNGPQPDGTVLAEMDILYTAEQWQQLHPTSVLAHAAAAWLA